MSHCFQMLFPQRSGQNELCEKPDHGVDSNLTLISQRPALQASAHPSEERIRRSTSKRICAVWGESPGTRHQLESSDNSPSVLTHILLGLSGIEQNDPPALQRGLNGASRAFALIPADRSTGVIGTIYCLAAMGYLKAASGDPVGGVEFALQGLRTIRHSCESTCEERGWDLRLVQADCLATMGYGFGVVGSTHRSLRFLRAAARQHANGGDPLSAAADCVFAHAAAMEGANDDTAQELLLEAGRLLEISPELSGDVRKQALRSALCHL